MTRNFFNKNKSVWMSHEDAVVKLPKNLKLSLILKIKLTIIENSKKKYMEFNFILKLLILIMVNNYLKISFFFLICKIKKKWSVISQKKD